MQLRVALRFRLRGVPVDLTGQLGQRDARVASRTQERVSDSSAWTKYQCTHAVGPRALVFSVALDGDRRCTKPPPYRNRQSACRCLGSAVTLRGAGRGSDRDWGLIKVVASPALPRCLCPSSPGAPRGCSPLTAPRAASRPGEGGNLRAPPRSPIVGTLYSQQAHSHLDHPRLIMPLFLPPPHRKVKFCAAHLLLSSL